MIQSQRLGRGDLQGCLQGPEEVGGHHQHAAQALGQGQIALKFGTCPKTLNPHSPNPPADKTKTAKSVVPGKPRNNMAQRFASRKPNCAELASLLDAEYSYLRNITLPTSAATTAMTGSLELTALAARSSSASFANSLA